jgi:tetratricopeptide (TPR) repeat protein
MATHGGDRIERAIAHEEWEKARHLIVQELNASPDSHWLLMRLGLTYYEQRRYARALKYEERALALMPTCPLVLWDYAGTLQMLAQHRKAVDVYLGIVRRGAARIARGPCGEGLGKARGLVADCYYRLFKSYEALGAPDEADRALVKHLDLRGPGCYSIYPLSDMRPTELLARVRRSAQPNPKFERTRA